MLRAQVDRLGLSHRVEWRGARAHPEVLTAYREADLFVLACKVARDGDRDGLPNVLIEAQSQRLACISTELVHDFGDDKGASDRVADIRPATRSRSPKPWRA